MKTAAVDLDLAPSTAANCSYPAAVTVTYFDPQPTGLPDRMPSPFGAPHPLAARAAADLHREVGRLGVDLAAPGAGKMFGVLVVATPDGRIGYLRAFSGMLGGTWHRPGYAGPTFDEAARAAFWPAGEAELGVFDAALAALADRATPIRTALAALERTHATELADQHERHRENKARRHAIRAAGATGAQPDAIPTTGAITTGLHELAQESRRDAAERKALLARHAAEREPLAGELARLEEERARIEQRKAERSRELLIAIHHTYAFANARGERRGVRELFAPAEPPGGAGDCAGPKLLAEAYRQELTPIAFAEIWCGAPPATGGRHDGTLYPACRGKCGPILTHALGGLATDPLPVFGVPAVGADEPKPLFEDDWIVIVDKPIGLLSVPGRGDHLRDSVQTRLRDRYPSATGPLLVHRLDLDTSGLLLAAKDEDTYKALQAAFARREIDKRYVAWLDGVVVGEAGTIDLALRVDVDDRPRQIHDPEHGKRAITDWRVLERSGPRTRVALYPRTGRTHQLRVHCAHPLGLAAPIIGDRLYARTTEDEPRMLLHAEAIAFTHPATGAHIELESRATF